MKQLIKRKHLQREVCVVPYYRDIEDLMSALQLLQKQTSLFQILELNSIGR